MSLEAVNSWVEARLTESINPIPPTYPHNMSCGILYNKGFTTSNVAINYAHPAKGLQIPDNNFAIVIRLLDNEEQQKTIGGARGEQEACYKVEIYAIYKAKFLQLSNESGVYTNEKAATKQFQAFCDMLKKTLRLSVYKRQSSTEFNAYNEELTDSVTGEKSSLVGKKPKATSEIEDAELGENDTDIIFGGVIFTQLTEVFQDAQ